MTGISKEFLLKAEALSKELFDLSDSIKLEPETGLNEHKTSQKLKGFLKNRGFKIKEGVAGMETAFSASFGGNRPRIALFAEMDALPGIGHGCGHNLSGVASIGAAAALKEALPDPFEMGEIIVLGTPAEELGIGKIEFVKAGVFDGIDAAMMVHASSKRCAVKRFLGLIRLNFAFIGKASHASAYPEQGVNALDAVILTFNAINALRQQIPSDCRVHGIITNGGRAPNIIPEKAEAGFYVRAGDIPGLLALKEKVIRCAEGAAIATGTALEVKEVGDMNAPMKINNAFAGVYRRALNSLGLKESAEPAEKNLGSSDIGNVSRIIPVIHPQAPIREGINIHTPEFADATASAEGHGALLEAVKCMGLTLIELFYDAGALNGIRRDFEESSS